jgi:hypothetical protein
MPPKISDDPKISDEHIEKVIRDEIEKYPKHKEALKGVMCSLIMKARNRINRVTSRIPIANPDNLISFSLEDTVKQREKELAYEEYCEFMEKEGEEPIEFDRFRKTGNNANAYHLFSEIKRMDIKTGDTITDENGKEWKITRITPSCRVAIIDEKGETNNLQRLEGWEKAD